MIVCASRDFTQLSEMDFLRNKLRVQGPFAAISLSDERRSLLKELQARLYKIEQRLWPGADTHLGASLLPGN
jgi:hypothetical protein